MTTTQDRAEQEHVGEQFIAPKLARNPGMPLNMDWVREVQINRSAVERRAATLPTR